MKDIFRDMQTEPFNIQTEGLSGLHRNNTRPYESLNSGANLKELDRVLNNWKVDEPQKKYVKHLYDWLSKKAGTLSDARKYLSQMDTPLQLPENLQDILVLRILFNSKNISARRDKPYH